MVSNDVARLAPGAASSGCHALLLTAQGRILADLHVLAREDELWLELARDALPEVSKHLERYVISDDVALSDESSAWRRFALEGPRAPALLARVAGAPVAIAPDSGVELSVAAATVVACAWGWSGEAAYQLFVPSAEADAVARAFADAGGADLEPGDAEVLEVLRIEAGTPRQGAELGPDVLPAETGLVGRAVSLSKGCYTGQEIVARMESRGAASHRLVGLRFDAPDAGDPPRGAPVVRCRSGSWQRHQRVSLRAGRRDRARLRAARARRARQRGRGGRGARARCITAVRAGEAAAKRPRSESGPRRRGVRQAPHAGCGQDAHVSPAHARAGGRALRGDARRRARDDGGGRCGCGRGDLALGAPARRRRRARGALPGLSRRAAVRRGSRAAHGARGRERGSRGLRADPVARQRQSRAAGRGARGGARGARPTPTWRWVPTATAAMDGSRCAARPRVCSITR